MAHNYHKITSAFKRTEEKSKTVNLGVRFDEYAEMFYNSDLLFTATEKVDGTNLNIIYDGNHVSFQGHTDKTTFAPEVEDWIKQRFCTPEFEQLCEQKFGKYEIKLCGELLGPKIQSNFYCLNDYKFVLFDVFNVTTNTWWKQDSDEFPLNVTSIAKEFNLERAPFVSLRSGEVASKATLKEWTEYIKSMENKDIRSGIFLGTEIEGIVVRPVCELTKANGERVIYKLKLCDIIGRPARHNLNI